MSIYKEVAILHSSSITTGFLSILGNRFLSLLYKAIDKSPYSCLFVGKDESGKVTGFISGALSVKKMYRWIILRYGILFFLYLLPLAFKKSFLSKILETLFYTNKQSSNIDHTECEAELLSMAVHESTRGTGIGSILVRRLDEYFVDSDIAEYKVVTFSEDKVSNGFYVKSGFKLFTQFTHHGNIMNEYLKAAGSDD